MAGKVQSSDSKAGKASVVRIINSVDLDLPEDDLQAETKNELQSGGIWRQWARNNMCRNPWRLPSLFLDFKSKRNPEPGHGTIEIVFPMQLLDGALEIPRALFGALSYSSRLGETYRGRILETAGFGVLALADSYFTHEKGHFYDRINAYSGQPSLPDLMTVAAGIESTQDASQSVMKAPYRGLLSDWKRVANQMDLPFYRLVSERVIKAFFTIVDKGDSASYLQMRRQMNGGRDESAFVDGLALWMALDPETLRSIVRLREYINTGKVSDAPFTQGYWTATFGGYLAPGGPLFEASSYYYLDSGFFPSFFRLALWFSPTETFGQTTAGIGIEAERFPVPGIEVLGFRFALDYGLSMWAQPKNIAGFKFPPTMLQGNVNFHAYRREIDVSGGIFCKNAGYFPNAPIEQGCHPRATFSFNPLLLFASH